MEPVQPSKPVRRETTISVAALRREEIDADKADVCVTLKGTSLVTGRAALKKAREVNQLVTALQEAGVKEEEISVLDIQVESSNGILTRSSAASYTLRIHCSKLELLGDILGVISTQKNITLDQLTWRYPDVKPMQVEWLQSCIAEAKQRASLIANALGVKLLAVRGFTEVWKDSEQPVRTELGTGLAELTRAVATRPRADLGFSLSHSKMVEQRVDLTYAIDRGEAEEPSR